MVGPALPVCQPVQLSTSRGAGTRSKTCGWIAVVNKFSASEQQKPCAFQGSNPKCRQPCAASIRQIHLHNKIKL